MRLQLRRGRLLTARDVAGAPLVAVVSETAARLLFPGQDPVGRRFSCCESDAPSRWKTVVGVVADARLQGLGEKAPPEFHLPAEQAPAAAWDLSGYGTWLVARAARGADPAARTAALRGAVRDVDRTVPVFSVETMAERLRTSLAQERFNTALLVAVGATASLIPARRATRVEAAVVLRDD